MCMLTALVPWREPQVWEKQVGMAYLTRLMTVNSDNGNRDGCGFAVPSGIIRWPEAAVKKLHEKEATEWLRDRFGGPIFAHVRARSHGTIPNGAHPFLVGDKIILAHNGTFTNTDEIAKERPIKNLLDGEKNPVDSHVLAALIANECGSKDLTIEMVHKSIERLSGSYALLMFETFNDNLWVIKGSNLLYLGKSGPYWVVNTSLHNLNTSNKYALGLSRVMFDREWDIVAPKPIEAYSTNLLTKKGLEKIGDAPNVVVTYERNTRGGHWDGNRWVRGGYNRAAITPRQLLPARTGSSYSVLKRKDTPTAVELAMLYYNIEKTYDSESLLFFFGEIVNKEWYECSTNQMKAIATTLFSLWKEADDTKEVLWKEICNSTAMPYCELDIKDMSFEFPWTVNNEETLQRALCEIMMEGVL